MSDSIVILINSLSKGGAERVITTLLNHWAGHYPCHLILLESQISYDLDPQVKITRLADNPNYPQWLKMIRIPFLAFKLIRIINRDRVGQVLSFMYRPNFINVLAGIFTKHRSVINECTFPSIDNKSGFSGIVKRILIKSLYPRSSLTIANALGNKKDLEENFSCQDVSVIYNPFDLEYIKKLSQINNNIKKTNFVCITVGRLVKSKNHSLLIEAIKDLKTVLWIIGDGPEMESLKQHVEQHQLEDKIFFLGQQDNPFNYLSLADCFVFGSNYEGFPNALVEALACGLPIVSTDCPSGPREILAPSTEVNNQLINQIEVAEYGILTPLNDMRSMKQAIDLVINDQSLRKNYAAKAKARAQDFCVEKIATLFLQSLNLR